MSEDSDSENDFESADEGETANTGVTNPVKSKSHANVNYVQGTTDEIVSKTSTGLQETGNITDQKEIKEFNLDETQESNRKEMKKSNHEEAKESDVKPHTVRPVGQPLQETSNKECKNIDTKPFKSESQLNESVTEEIRDLPQKTERVLLLKERKELEKVSRTNSAGKDGKLSAHPVPEEKNSPGWGLGGWSSSFLSTVASSASTFTSHVTQGIGTVLETVEASLGAPSPEEMASLAKKVDKVEDQALVDKVEDQTAGTPSGVVPEIGHAVGGILGGVSAFTRVLETTGSKVITGGLDTLELIGKKTMDILTEGDPGLRKKRNLFGVGTDTTLSQVLRDAKKKYEEGNFVSEDSTEEASLMCYSKIFDDNQGLVHLEALEILSGRSKAQLEEQLLVLGPDAESFHTTLQELRTTCLDLPPTDDTPDDEATQDFVKLINQHMSALPINLNIDKIKTVQSETRNWVNICKSEQEKGKIRDAKEIYEKIITSLAELTARSMELFHKMSELLLVTGSDLADLHSFAQHFTGLTSVLCTEIGILTSQYCQCLSTAADDSEDPDAVNPLITNVYLEASNSNTYIQDAFQLLIPVFQEIAIRK